MEMTSKAESLMKGYGVSVFRLPVWGSLVCVLLTGPITRTYIYILNVLCTGVDLGLAQDQQVSCFTLPCTQHIPIEQHGNRLCKWVLLLTATVVLGTQRKWSSTDWVHYSRILN